MCSSNIFVKADTQEWQQQCSGMGLPWTTPLHEALHHGNVAAAQALLDGGHSLQVCRQFAAVDNWLQPAVLPKLFGSESLQDSPMVVVVLRQEPQLC
jgi:hypothetical protein